jgi:ParB family chromosome partitioning protein
MTSKSNSQKNLVQKIQLENIIADPGQPRKSLSSRKLQELKASLINQGTIDPIIIRPDKGGKYMIVVGERRYRAAKEAGFESIDCIVRSDINDQTAREMQLAENHQREDINPMEQAKAIHEYITTYGITQNELSRRTGIPQRTISDRLALLSLPVSVHAKIETGEIGPYEALQIAKLPASVHEILVQSVTSGKLGGRQLEKLSAQIRANPNTQIDGIIRRFIPIEDEESSPTKDVLAQPKNIPAIPYIESEFEKFRSLMQYLATKKREDCDFFTKDGVCDLTWENWKTMEDVPKFMGNPVSIEGKLIGIKPSEILCAICHISLWCVFKAEFHDRLADELAGNF